MACKSRQQMKGIGGSEILIALAFIVLVGAVNSGVKIPMSISGLGFTTLSASQIHFQSTDPILNGQVWVMTVSPGGLGQTAKGATLPTQTISASDGSGQRSNEPLEIDIASQNNYCEYPIRKDTSIFPVSTYGYKKYLLTTSDSDLVSDCSKLGSVVSYGKFPISLDKACIYKNARGMPGNINEPHTYITVDASIQKGSEAPITKTISNKADTTVKFGDVAYAQWSGGLQTYDTCPLANQRSRMAMYDYYSASWRVVDSSIYGNYKSIVQPQENYYFSDENTLKNAIAYWNNLADQSMFATGFYSDKGAGISAPAGGIDNGIVKMKIDDALQIPIITFYIKTAWLTIAQPVPAPVITSVTAGTASTGGSVTISVDVKNNGESGVVQSFITCNAPITVTSGTVEKQMSTGATATFIHTVTSGSVTTKTVAGCVATAKALSQSSTYQFNVNVDPLKVCEPNVKSCVSDTIVQCNAEGSQKTVVENCGAKNQVCSTDNSGYIACVDKDKANTAAKPGINFNNPVILLLVLFLVLVVVMKSKGGSGGSAPVVVVTR